VPLSGAEIFGIKLNFGKTQKNDDKFIKVEVIFYVRWSKMTKESIRVVIKVGDGYVPSLREFFAAPITGGEYGGVVAPKISFYNSSGDVLHVEALPEDVTRFTIAWRQKDGKYSYTSWWVSDDTHEIFRTFLRLLRRINAEEAEKIKKFLEEVGA
jgi:hypothetical protein